LTRQITNLLCLLVYISEYRLAGKNLTGKNQSNLFWPKCKWQKEEKFLTLTPRAYQARRWWCPEMESFGMIKLDTSMVGISLGPMYNMSYISLSRTILKR